MSQKNVEIVLAAFDAWNRGDHDAFVDLWGEEAEFWPFRAQLEGRAYRGRDGLRRFIAEVAGDWEELRFQVDEMRDAGEQMAGRGRFRARGKASGVEVDAPFGFVGGVRDKKVVYARFFSDPADALEAAGLRE
jgi:ketosteroid isomerase-like protein